MNTTEGPTGFGWGWLSEAVRQHALGIAAPLAADQAEQVLGMASFLHGRADAADVARTAIELGNFVRGSINPRLALNALHLAGGAILPTTPVIAYPT